MLCEPSLNCKRTLIYLSCFSLAFFLSYATNRWLLNENGSPFKGDSSLTTYLIFSFLGFLVAKLFSDSAQVTEQSYAQLN